MYFISVFCFFCAVCAHFGANLRLQHQTDERRENFSVQSPCSDTFSATAADPICSRQKDYTHLLGTTRAEASHH